MSVIVDTKQEEALFSPVTVSSADSPQKENPLMEKVKERGRNWGKTEAVPSAAAGVWKNVFPPGFQNWLFFPRDQWLEHGRKQKLQMFLHAENIFIVALDL